MPVHDTHHVAPPTERGQRATQLPELRWLRPHLSAALQTLPDASLWRTLQDHLRAHWPGGIERALQTLGELVARSNPSTHSAAVDSQSAVIHFGNAQQAATATQRGVGTQGAREASWAGNQGQQPTFDHAQPSHSTRHQSNVSASHTLPLLSENNYDRQGEYSVRLAELAAGDTQQALYEALIPLWLQQAGLPGDPGQRAQALTLLNAYRHLLDHVYLSSLQAERDPQVLAQVERLSAEQLRQRLEQRRHQLQGQTAQDQSEALQQYLSTNGEHSSERRTRSPRVQLDRTTAYPFSAICQLRVLGSDGYHLATGCYIAPNLILTSASALRSRRNGSAQQVIVTPGRQSLLQQPWPSFIVEQDDIVLHPSWRADQRASNNDLAVLLVQTPPGHARPLEVHAAARLDSDGVAICGYSDADRNGEDGNRQTLALTALRSGRHRDMIQFEGAAGQGLLGAPVLTLQDGRVQVIGVQGEQADGGCRLNETSRSWLQAVRQRASRSHTTQTTDRDPQDWFTHNTTSSQRDGSAHGQRRQSTQYLDNPGQLLSGARTDLTVDAPEAMDALEEMGVFAARSASFLRLVKGGEGDA